MIKQSQLIAEIGLNHMGNEDYAHKLVEGLVQTKVDAITFQIREPSFYLDNPNLILRDKFYINIIEKIKEKKKIWNCTL